MKTAQRKIKHIDTCVLRRPGCKTSFDKSVISLCCWL